MKEAIKLALELLKLGRQIHKAWRKESDEKRKRKIAKAIKDRNLAALRRLTLGK